jgi:hypothetical protein
MLALPAALLYGDALALAAPAAVTVIELVPMLCDGREDRIDHTRGSFRRSCPARPEHWSQPVSSKRAGATLRRYRRVSRAASAKGHLRLKRGANLTKIDSRAAEGHLCNTVTIPANEATSVITSCVR